MFRSIVITAVLAIPFLLCGGEFSLKLNEEYALVKHHNNTYRFNLHPLPPSQAQLVVRNGKKNETHMHIYAYSEQPFYIYSLP